MRGERRSDDELLAATGRDARAFGEFYRRYETPILAYFRRATGRADLAADLTAETFARALESAAAFDPSRGVAGGWLYGIARHVLARSLERGRVEHDARERLDMPDLLIGDEITERIDAIADGEEGARALELLVRLPADQQEAIRLRVLDEGDYAELAERLECSEAVVRKRVSRGLSTIRRLLGEDA